VLSEQGAASATSPRHTSSAPARLAGVTGTPSRRGIEHVGLA
jgi:hypothetical protein